jgi:adenosylhomocysteine nucleosidase
MIAITFALPAESSGIVGLLRERRDENRIVYGKLASRDVAIFHTGVGRTACGRSMEQFLNTIRPTVLISSGFAGGVSEDLQVGDLVVAENFSDRNLAARLMEGGAPATPLPAPDRLKASSQELAPPSKAGIRIAKLVTVDSMVDSAAERHELVQRHAADAIDMETEVIAQACLTFGVPMLSLRVISDSPTEPFPAPPEILFDVARQKTNFGKLIPYVLMHPSAIGRLIRFARQINYSRSTLTTTLLEVVPRLG